eukprot:3976804-Prorocentrum_lima.AAC.1
MKIVVNAKDVPDATAAHKAARRSRTHPTPDPQVPQASKNTEATATVRHILTARLLEDWMEKIRGVTNEKQAE